MRRPAPSQSAEALEPAHPDVFLGAVAGPVVDHVGAGDAALPAAGSHVVQLASVSVPAAEAASQARRAHAAGVALHPGWKGRHVTHAQQQRQQQQGKGGKPWGLKARERTQSLSEQVP